MSKVLSYRGYNVPKNDLTVSELETIKKELTVKPKDMMGFEQTVEFEIFQESASRIYVPKCYGLKRFGKPDVFKIQDGEDVDFKFVGTLRDEQNVHAQKYLEAARNPDKLGGLVNLQCGAGKTVIALYIMSVLKKKTLIIVHKDFLLNQWKDRIEEYIEYSRIGYIKGPKTEIRGNDIVIASLQSLSMKEYDKEIFDGFGLVIVDECHHTSAQVFSRALNKVNFRYSLGLSATMTRKDGLSKVFKYYLGDVVTKATKRLDSDVDVKIKEYYVTDQNYGIERKMCSNKLNIVKMITDITTFHKRDQYIVRELSEILQKEPQRKVLLLSDRRNHLENLCKLLIEKGIESGIYYGGIKASMLPEIERKQVILATFAIASEGYDQKGLDTLVLASPKSDIVQSVGRILRTKKEERKHKPLIIDIVDAYSIFERQGDKRRKYYDSCGYFIDENRIPDTRLIELNKCCIVDV